MALGRKALIALLVIAAVPLSVPAIAYGVGLLKVQGRPVPANPASAKFDWNGPAALQCAATKTGK